MIIDAPLLPCGTVLDTDVVVVGSGPAGLTVAEGLCAAGRRVILLEAGDIGRSRQRQDPLRGESVGAPFPLVRSRQRSFAGTAAHWTAETGLRIRALDPIDFDARPGVHGGWPFEYCEMGPYYDRAHAFLGLTNDYCPGRWYQTGTPTALAWEGGPQLAMFQFADHRVYRDRLAVMRGSKRIELILNGTARTIVLADDSDSVERIEVVTAKGTGFSVRGSVYVLACGGLDNARMLLASPGRTGAGVGNENDNVGRHLMEHVSIDSGVIGETGSRLDVSAFAEQRRGDGSKYQPMLWAGGELLRREGLPNAAFWVNRVDARLMTPAVRAARVLYASRLTRPMVPSWPSHVADVLRGAPEVAAFAWRRARNTPADRTVVALRVMAEQVPDRESRVTLTDRRDAVGMPRIRVDWRVSKADYEHVRGHQELLSRLLQTAGLGPIVRMLEDDRQETPLTSNYHHMGTTLMDPDPRRGVVDTNSKVHGVANLYVAGSSVFPTGGYVNPTLTIIALAYRLADHLARELRPVAV